MSFTDPFGCGPGSPCREILNQISKYDIPEYYPTASDYLSCFTEDQIPCSAITHCISGKTGTDTYVTGTTFVSDQAIVTRNDSTDVLFLSGGTNVTLSNPKTNLIKIDVPDSTITPILIVSNAMSISNPVGSTEYIGDAKAGGWNAISWNLPKPSFTYEHLNCGVPFPHTINSSVSNALNVCGNLFVNGHRETVNVHIKIYKFECVEGSTTPALTLLFTLILEVPQAEEGFEGVNKCWSMNVSNGEDKITECTTHFMISFTLIQEESGVTIIKSSYKATIENIA